MDSHAIIEVRDDSEYSPYEVDLGALSLPSIRYSLKAFINRVSALNSHLSRVSVIDSASSPASPCLWRLSSMEIEEIDQSIRFFQREPYIRPCLRSY